MESNGIKRVVIVGGGTAGWLSACVLAAARRCGEALNITLIEAPDIPAIGVGEGTWPTMRGTLQDIGIGEQEFLRSCSGSFKQGSQFNNWVSGSAGDSYLHPFTPPATGDMGALLTAWDGKKSFAEAVSAQATLVSQHLSPRQSSMPDYAGAVNYAYHLDAGKFAALLARHATGRFGVRHIADKVTDVQADSGMIAAVVTAANGVIEGDFFIDCSGHAALLIGTHYGVAWMDRSNILLNDRAMAVQVPVMAGSEIASVTVATAHRAGWIWDIGLPERRGIGCVYSSRFASDDEATKILRNYITEKMPETDVNALAPRRLTFPTGHREQFWRGNCVAIGLSAGFLEPLEASAIVMIELSLKALSANFPRSRKSMDFLAGRFNALFRYRWDRIIEFLKLHYLLSQRSEPYWLAQRDPASIPERLNALLALWAEQPPSNWDFPQSEEIFPAESHQYILYGMGFAPPPFVGDASAASTRIKDISHRARSLAAALPTNRAVLDLINSPQPDKAECLA